MYYIHKDYLGSYETITDGDGNIVEKLSFDPWGRRRNPTDWSFDNVSTSFLFDRGYTGHEHLDEFGLINMNGRVYDPFLARFLSPDPLVQAPGYGQNYNRYSYAFNNPLKYTDPDGEYAHLIIGALFGGTMNWLANGAEFSWQGLGYFGVGAAAGALSAGIGAGIGGLVSGAGSFSFSVASSLSVGGVFPGMAIGASAGFTNGFISGTGNSLIAGNKLGSSLGNGLKMGAIQGGTGALFGGIAGGIRARGYGGDLWTGKRNVPISTGRLPFNGNVQIEAPELETSLSEFKNLDLHTIEVNRTWETTKATFDKFSIDEGQIEGYFMEPQGPSSMIEGSGLRISKGIYQLDSYSSTKFPDHFILRGVPGRTQVLIHGGTVPANTSACFVIGNEVGANSISGWQEMMNSLRTYIINNGGARKFYMIVN